MFLRWYVIFIIVFSCLTTISAADKTIQIVTQGFVKVHKGPSSSATVIAFAKFGEYYPVTMETSAWIKIEYIEVEGWVERKHIKVISGLGKPIAPITKPKVQEPKISTSSKIDKPKQPVIKKTPKTVKSDDRRGTSIHDTPSQLKKNDTWQRQPALQKRTDDRIKQIPRNLIPKKNAVIKIAADTVKKVKTVTTTKKEVVKPAPLSVITETLYVQVIIPQLNVFSNTDTTSPLLGIAAKDEYFLLLRKTNLWFNIPFGDTTGWVEQCYVKVVDKQEQPFLTGFKSAAIVILIVIVIMILAGVFFLIQRQKSARRVSVKKSVLLITKRKTEIMHSLTNTPTTVEACFTEIEFTTRRVKDLKVAENRIFYHVPDVLMVDWMFSKTIEQDIEGIITSGTSISSIPVVFYNVPDSVRMENTKKHGNVYYLDISFTSMELFKIVTPQITTGHKSRIIRKSVQSAAMEGEIHEGSLHTVFQFVEIGHKTGSLIIDDKTPFGFVYFEKGIIVYAASRNNKARKALEEILHLKKGYFRFTAKKKEVENNCNLPIMPVLMEFAQKNDEGYNPKN